jgi:uncharacterized membrane protein YedE/YeeE
MAKLTAFVCGLLFGLGVLLAGMADPAKVLAFLDLAGDWDPSLALVMAQRRARSLLGGTMQMPTRRDLDARLVLGSLLFGVGWGIAGICPGPALAVLLSGHWQPLLFVAAMLAGMLIFAALEGRRRA